MENKKDIISEDKIINLANQYQVKNITKNGFIQKVFKKNIFQKYSKMINFILLEIIFLLLPKIIISEYSMDIKVNKIGYNQIFSDEYIGQFPSNILVNELPLLWIKKIIYVDSLQNSIHLEWDNPIYNFSFMFSDLTSITSVKMNYELQNNSDMSYMFYNCYNLQNFAYYINNTDNLVKINMTNMFYNCQMLQNFNFSLNASKFINVFTANMFFNCQSLKTIIFDYNINVNDMTSMFFNCISLEKINFEKIQTTYSINISYMFYNCSKLTTIISKSSNIKISDMRYMFYNCGSLNKVNISYFIGSNSYINMANCFYNCYNLSQIEGSFENLIISDTSKIFYNCVSLISLNFNPKQVKENINMTKMFYNCEKINKITFTISENNNNELNSYFYPNDLYYTFYNCKSLTSVEFNFFKTDYVKEISYMFFNCKKLTHFSMKNSNFSNSLITNMKGMFQNCESLITLDLSLFYVYFCLSIVKNLFINL